MREHGNFDDVIAVLGNRMQTIGLHRLVPSPNAPLIQQLIVVLIRLVTPDIRLSIFLTMAWSWKHFPCYWPFVWGIHRSLVNSPHKGQWRGPLMFSFICAWINGWVNNHEAGDLRCHHAHYDVTVIRLSLVTTKLTPRPQCDWNSKDSGIDVD